MFREIRRSIDYGDNAEVPLACWIYDEQNLPVHETQSHEPVRSLGPTHVGPRNLEDCALQGHNIEWIMKNISMQQIVENWGTTYDEMCNVYPELKTQYANSAWRREACYTIKQRFERSKRMGVLNVAKSNSVKGPTTSVSSTIGSAIVPKGLVYTQPRKESKPPKIKPFRLNSNV